MKAQILSKLAYELKNFHTEAQVVYILTRIGKLLEIDHKKELYPHLYFYRNWSVHAKINDTSYVTDYLESFIHNTNRRHILLMQLPLKKEINLFLQAYSLQQLGQEQLNQFVFLLGRVISDTPVLITLGNSQYQVNIREPPGIGWSGQYSISVSMLENAIKVS